MGNSDLIHRRGFLRATGLGAAALLVRPGLGAERRGLIEKENRRAGSTDWLLKKLEPARSKEGDGLWQRRTAVEAYCSHTSIRSGETLRVYVSTDPPTRYQAEVFRMGYYGGKGGRRMLRLGPFRGQVQPTPTDGPKDVIQCRWSPGFDLKIPRGWLSGVYLGKLTALGSGYESYFIFIVRDDRRADFLFQCSDNTWQAYNRWPAWRSLYDWKGNRWNTKPGSDVSFDRPYSIYYNKLPADFNPLTNGSAEFLLWEHPLCFWMEKEGCDVTYISNLDTHTDPKGLLRAKGFLSVGHDEYWTQEMMDHVAAARDAGVSLAFLGGNSVDGQIVLSSGTDGRANRVFGRLGSKPDDDFENEQELMGASSYGVGAADWICQAPKHWIFDGTGMKKGDRIPQLVGWEYHGQPLRQDNTLVVLATGTVREGQKTTEKTYAATLYTAAKGNYVFNAATCWWNMLLERPPGAVDPPHTDFSRPDPRVQQITRNLFAHMIHPE
jgi:hypothetical protein